MSGLQKSYKHVYSVEELNTAAGEGWRFVAVVYSDCASTSIRLPISADSALLSVIYLMEREQWVN